MGGIPLGARKEKIADYTRRCRPIAWQEERIQASDRTEIALCVGSSAQSEAKSATDEDAIILYFQGNASSLPPRLPYLSDVLRSLSSTPSNLGPPTKIRYTLVAVSYRGFWTSQGRPSQKGIELDVAAALQWVERTYGTPGSNVNVVLWGQSIGAGIATTAAARYLAMHSLYKDPTKSQRLNIQALILETPFTSVGSMLIALYPQKWLPYRYLGPFLRNWWDSEAALHQIESLSMGAKPKILLLQSGQDELVPKEHGIALEDLCRHLGMDVDRKVVPGALHTEAMARGEGRSSISRFLRKIAA
ncbi:MAG: hypothetical protein M1827_001271 [Pycnora praestabilis]|nr:MAG: hypothetical protein M1827_001271 [Pycnora praestabilis]